MAHSFPPEPLPEEDWDVLILGTGLKQSLLACALSRASKKVLQLDPSDTYGSSEASFSNLYSEVDRWVEAINSPSSASTGATTTTTLSSSSHQPQQPHQSPFSRARVWRNPSRLAKGGGQWTVTLSPQVIYWENKLLGVLREVEMTSQFVWQAVGGWWVYNDGSVDAEDSLLDGGSGGVMGMVQNVGMKAAKAGLKAKGWNKGRRKAAGSVGSISEVAQTSQQQTSIDSSSTSTDVTQQAAQLLSSSITSTTPSTLRTIPPTLPATTKVAHLKETPCTFEDIAWDPTLTDHHRTILASFLRHVLQATSTSASTSTSTSAASESPSEQSLHTLLTSTYPLPSHVRQSIHALTLLPIPITHTPTSLAISRLRIHFLSLGRIPDIRSAAALFTQYGCASEMCQVFCRGAAVAGGVCVLGRGVTSLSYTATNTPPTVVLTTGETISPKFIVKSQWDHIPQSQQSPTSPTTPTPAPARRFKCAIYAISSPLTSLFRAKYPDERINPGGAIIVYYPPPSPTTTTTTSSSSSSSKNPIHILARAAAHGECPQGNTLLYISQLYPESEGEPIDAEAEYSSLETAVEAILAPFREVKPETSDISSSGGGSNESPKSTPTAEQVEVVFKLFYTQHQHLPPTNEKDSQAILTLSDVPLDFILDGEQEKSGGSGGDVVEDVMRIYSRIMRAGVEEGMVVEESEIREGFMQVSEETRRLMRENDC